ncbi:MAG TPA: ThiF family adenylyltransferase [Vicinamibacterales bacterium]|nr:ThiF family adenylyltransferase [Vicinamibacterales bacterium]
MKSIDLRLPRLEVLMRRDGQGPYVPPNGDARLLKLFLGATSWTLTLPALLAEQLHQHLFPGDGDEHGAVVLAGIADSLAGPRLLARDVVLAIDGKDYVPGQHGYRMLTPQFVSRVARRCRDERLAYLAVHNHGGTNHVQFSDDDYASHKRGYPALLDIVDGLPVGALVFAKAAVAGSLWISPSHQLPLSEARVLGARIERLTPEPVAPPAGRARTYDRQARVFGDRGQDILRRTKVGIIGAGGIGSLIVEFLSRLGVGHFVIVDPDIITETNVPRITGSTHRHAASWFTSGARPQWLRRIGERLARTKVRHMRRLIRRAQPRAKVEVIRDDVLRNAVAHRFCDCDYLVLAADSMQARLVFNALVHAFLIPGVQVGVKVPVDVLSGEVGEIFCADRPVLPSSGCLWCNGLITAAGLQRESERPDERRAQRYVDEEEVIAPSVITLNAIAAALAANDFMFAMTGLTKPDTSLGYTMAWPRERAMSRVAPRRDPACPHCGSQHGSILARGDAADLHTRC